MSTIAQIRDALKVRLDTLTATTDLQVYDTMPGVVVVPAAIIRVESIIYDTTMHGESHDPTFTILLLASTADNRAGQDTLDSFLDASSSTSIKAAVEADFTLGGTVHFATVTQVRNYGIVEYAGDGLKYFGAEIIVPTGMPA